MCRRSCTGSRPWLQSPFGPRPTTSWWGHWRGRRRSSCKSDRVRGDDSPRAGVWISSRYLLLKGLRCESSVATRSGGSGQRMMKATAAARWSWCCGPMTPGVSERTQRPVGCPRRLVRYSLKPTRAFGQVSAALWNEVVADDVMMSEIVDGEDPAAGACVPRCRRVLNPVLK